MYSITTSSSDKRQSPTALPTSSWVKTKRWTGVASACSSQTYQSLPLGRSAALVIEESYFKSSYLSSRLMSGTFQRPSDGSSKRSQVGTTLLSRLPGDPHAPRRAPRRTKGAFVSCWPPVPPTARAPGHGWPYRPGSREPTGGWSAEAPARPLVLGARRRALRGGIAPPPCPGRSLPDFPSGRYRTRTDDLLVVSQLL